MTRESHSLRSACCDGSWQNRQQGEEKQKSKKRTQPQNKEREVALGGVEPPQSASRGGPVATSLPQWLLSLSGYSYQYQRHTQRATGPVATSLPHMAPVPRLATAVSILTS